jgi:hypothetical protein
MVYFHTKTPAQGKFGGRWNGKCVVYFSPFGLFHKEIWQPGVVFLSRFDSGQIDKSNCSILIRATNLLARDQCDQIRRNFAVWAHFDFFGHTFF